MPRVTIDPAYAYDGNFKAAYMSEGTAADVLGLSYGSVDSYVEAKAADPLPTDARTYIYEQLNTYVDAGILTEDDLRSISPQLTSAELSDDEAAMYAYMLRDLNEATVDLGPNDTAYIDENGNPVTKNDFINEYANLGAIRDTVANGESTGAWWWKTEGTGPDFINGLYEKLYQPEINALEHLASQGVNGEYDLTAPELLNIYHNAHQSDDGFNVMAEFMVNMKDQYTSLGPNGYRDMMNAAIANMSSIEGFGMGPQFAVDMANLDYEHLSDEQKAAMETFYLKSQLLVRFGNPDQFNDIDLLRVDPVTAWTAISEGGEAAEQFANDTLATMGSTNAYVNGFGREAIMVTNESLANEVNLINDGLTNADAAEAETTTTTVEAEGAAAGAGAAGAVQTLVDDRVAAQVVDVMSYWQHHDELADMSEEQLAVVAENLGFDIPDIENLSGDQIREALEDGLDEQAEALEAVMLEQDPPFESFDEYYAALDPSERNILLYHNAGYGEDGNKMPYSSIPYQGGQDAVNSYMRGRIEGSYDRYKETLESSGAEREDGKDGKDPVEVGETGSTGEASGGANRTEDYDRQPNTDTQMMVDASELNGNNVNIVIQDIVGSQYDSAIADSYEIDTADFTSFANENDLDLSGVSDNDLKMMALLHENGLFNDPNEISSYLEASADERNEMMAGYVGEWLNDPNATGKEVLTGNLIIQTLEGNDDRTLGILHMQSVDTMFGSDADIHVNTWFNNNLTADSLAMADEMLDSRYEKGEITEDQYLELGDSLESKAMMMCFMGNNTMEMTASLEFLKQDFLDDNDGKTPEEVLQAWCEDNDLDYQEMLDHIENPEVGSKDGYQESDDNAYRWPFANGEVDAPDNVIDAYNIIALDRATDGGQKAGEANNLLREALTAGIQAFRDVLSKSAMGQQLLMVCNAFVHKEPLNGTLFQEIWDMDSVEYVGREPVVPTGEIGTLPPEEPDVTPEPVIPGETIIGPAGIPVTTVPPTTPDPGTPDPGTPDPGTPDPGTPDPGTPDPGTPDPGTPDPGTPDPGIVDPPAGNQGEDIGYNPDVVDNGGSQSTWLENSVSESESGGESNYDNGGAETISNEGSSHDESSNDGPSQGEVDVEYNV